MWWIGWWLYWRPTSICDPPARSGSAFLFSFSHEAVFVAGAAVVVFVVVIVVVVVVVVVLRHQQLTLPLAYQEVIAAKQSSWYRVFIIIIIGIVMTFTG